MQVSGVTGKALLDLEVAYIDKEISTLFGLMTC
jgi:hypothetical protein